jgi:ubiquitin carboxyl-terminal hydrolase 5/13
MYTISVYIRYINRLQQSNTLVLTIKMQATRITKIERFPKYLMLHMRRYYVDDTWTPQKLDVKVDAPEKISLEDFRAGQKEVSE